MTLSVLCPAKLNLFLAVGPRDFRGYHPLRTIFQTIDLCDRLSISTDTNATEIRCDWEGLPAENTLTKTLRLLQEIVKLPPLRIELEKRIPDQSGLAGGSSDAAGMIRAVSKLLPTLPEAELRSVATAIGADVPFFLVGGRARGEGYGEILEALPTPRNTPMWVTVVKPDLGCNTADMYSKLDALSFEWREFPAGDELYNDFERVAPPECLDLIEEIRALGARDAGLSGSGSAVFGRFGEEAAAKSAALALRKAKHERCWAVRMLDRNEMPGLV